MSIKALGTALYWAEQATGKTIDLLYLDGCSLGMVEIAYEVKQQAHYMIASPNTDWSSFNYNQLLAVVDANQYNVRQLSEKWLDLDVKMIDAYNLIYMNRGYPYTYTLIDLHKMDDLAQATKNFSAQLQSILATQKTDILSAFVQSDRYESDYNEILNEDDAYTDFYSFAYEIERQFPNQPGLLAAAQAVRTAINEAVVKKAYRSGTCWFCYDAWEWKNYGGFGIYLPLGWDEERRKFYTSDHLMWVYDTNWDKFLAAYHQLPMLASGFYYPLTERAPRPLLTCEQTTDETCQGLARPLPFPESSIYLPLIAR